MGKLGKTILDEMRESVEDINFSDKKKKQIKKAISDWSNVKLMKQALLVDDNERSSVNAYSQPERIKEVFITVIRLRERVERHKHKQVLHGLRAEVYRKKLKEEGYDPNQVIDEACEGREDLKDRIIDDLEKVEIEFPDREDESWVFK